MIRENCTAADAVAAFSAIVFLVSLFASVSAHAAAYGGLADEEVPRFAVPRIAKPPVIDGTLDEAEWRGACAVSGVAAVGTNELAVRPTTFFLAWDPGHLYLAARVWVMPGYGKPRATGRSPGMAATADDGLELVFTPRGKNVPPSRPEMAFKWNINCLGYTGQLQRITLGQMMRNWNPDFETAVRLTAPGSAPQGGRWLEVEVAMTPADFELDGPNRAGDAWGMMLAFNNMGERFARVPGNSGYFDPQGHSFGVLVEAAPVVQMRMEEMPGLLDGKASVTVEVFNPTEATAVVDVELDWREEEAGQDTSKEVPSVEKELLHRKQALTVAPGKTAVLQVAEALPRSLERNRGKWACRATWGKTELLRYTTFFREGYPKAHVQGQRAEEAFPLSIRYDPIGSTLLIQTDSYYLENPEAAARVEYALTPAGNKSETLAAGTLDESTQYYFTDLVQLPPLAPGRYRLEASLIEQDGTRLGPMEKTFERLDEAAVFGDWYRQGLGDVERVIPPFAPVTVAADAVSVWARRYRIDALGLPRQIESGGWDVLQAPARVVVVRDGQETVIATRPSPVFDESKPWRLSFHGQAEGAGLALSAAGWIEQDGLCYLNLTYGPQQEAVAVDALRLEFPLSEAVAECLVCTGDGGNFAARTDMVLPKEEGSLWTTLDTGITGARMTVGSFYPCVWLGSERAGLAWWADNDAGWFPDDEVPAHEVVRRGGAVILINHLIGKPVTLEGEHTVTFSYNASPFKPLPDSWRSTIRSVDGTFVGPHKRRTDPKTGKTYDYWWALHPPSPDPEEWPSLWRDYKTHADERIRKHGLYQPWFARSSHYVHTSIPMVGYVNSAQSEVYRYFAPTWASGRLHNFSESHGDYLLWLVKRNIEEGGVRTFYWDVVFPTVAVATMDSVQAGLGYRLPDGRIQPGYVGFKLRRFMMRMASLCHDKGLMPGANMVHSTNAYVLVALPWVSAVLDGEDHHVRDQSPFDWVDGWSTDRMRSLSCPHNFGTPVSWMEAIRLTDKARRSEMVLSQLEYVRLFDCWTMHNYYTATERALEWGVIAPDTEFVPFWRNDLVTSEDGEVLVSLWKRPHRVLLDVFNYNRETAKDITVKVDLERLGLRPARPWQEFIRVSAVDQDERFAPRDTNRQNVIPDREGWRTAPEMDIEKQTLTLRGVLPHRGRFITINRYGAGR